MRTTFWSRNLKGRDQLEDLSLDGRIRVRFLDSTDLKPGYALWAGPLLPSTCFNSRCCTSPVRLAVLHTIVLFPV